MNEIQVIGGSLPACPYSTPAERINFRFRQASEHAALAIMAAIEAGRELLAVKAKLPHGSWGKWVEKHVCFSPDTAENFIKMYAKSIGEDRAALPSPIGVETPVSEDEFAVAIAKHPATSPTAFLKALSAAQTSPNWGGPRPNSGRPALIPADGASDTIRSAAAAKWGEVQRSAGSFLSHKFELALRLDEVRQALQLVDTLRDALSYRLAELEGGRR